MHILFADDERNLQELMRTELPRMGYSVTVCPDGLTAVAALEKEPFDCLLVDLDMPGMHGIEVIERARQIRLSDGSHFDNLGLYELLRRRLELIVVADSSGDPDFSFWALAPLQSKKNDRTKTETSLAFMV